ncbi:MAG TPA: hypothetical protein VEW45_05175 [Candidatus Dormibacteraeota bacterium]|nr:hypothetical protein [Candidatus Dormibacteraeota bacterium]
MPPHPRFTLRQLNRATLARQGLPADRAALLDEAHALLQFLHPEATTYDVFVSRPA